MSPHARTAVEPPDALVPGVSPAWEGLGMDEPSGLDRATRLSNLVKTAPPFVGRRDELAWLEKLLEESCAGQPRVVLIPGDAGIGKTRLLQELRSSASYRGLQVGYGRGYEDLTLPYLPFVEVLRPLRDQIPPHMASMLGTEAEVISRLLGYDVIPGLTAPPSGSPQTDQDKLKLFLTMSHLMVVLSQQHPMLLVVDDLHWVDRPSLDLLSHLVFTVTDLSERESLPLLIVGTYRPVESETHLGRLIARFQRETICQTFALAGLHEVEIHELVRHLGLIHPSHQLVTVVTEATQGNPLFIQEVVHHLVRQEAIRERGGFLVTTASPANIPLPEQVTGAIIARTSELSEDCRKVVTLCSFLGDSFSLPILAAVSDLDEETILNLIEEGMHHRLLLSEGQMFQFAHPLIRHVFYNQPSAARRQRIHHQIARSLEYLYADDLDAHVMEIAHHFVRAGPATEANILVKYARRAGDQAFRVFAWGNAAQHYEAALAAGEFTGCLSLHDRAELYYWAGLAHYRDQDVGPCLDHYEKAIESYRQCGNVKGLARVLMEKTRTQFTLASVPYGTLIDLQQLEEVLNALGDSDPGLCCSISTIMSEVYWTARQADKAKTMAQRALDIGCQLQDDQLSAAAGLALGMAQSQGLELQKTLRSYQDSLAYARRANDLLLQSWALQRMPLTHTMLGQLDEADTVAQSACELTRKTQDWGFYSVALSHQASVAVARGNFATVEQRTHEAMQMVSRSHYPWGGSRSLFALACSRTLQGAWAEAKDALDLQIEPGRVFQEAGPIIHAFTQAFHHLLQAISGREEEPIEQVVANLMVAVGTDSYSLAPLCALVEIADFLAAPSAVEAPYQMLLMAAERGVLFTSGWVFLLPRVLGVATTLLGQRDVAEAHFRAAIEAATRAAAQPELGRTYLDYARTLIGRGELNDRCRAIALLRQAASIFSGLGMDPFFQRATQLAEMLQVPVQLPSSKPVDSPHALNTQEVAVLVQIAEGKTYQEIADDLMLRPGTVSHYVHGLFHKIGVNGRADAVAYVHEQGLASQVFSHRRTTRPASSAHMGNTTAAQFPLIVLVTDMEASTALIQRLGDEQAYEVLRIHNATIRECLRRYEGVEVTHTGDGIEASFFSASSAVACAVAIQKAFSRHNRDHPTHTIRIRIGINAGEPISTEGRFFGVAVHAAFRICARAQAGHILVSDLVHQLVAGKAFDFVNRGRIKLKGFPGRFRLYEVRWEDEGGEL
jgi:class 3 adenylate cyclase/DNA-binding CsgD family transcriptional regulator